MQKLYLNTIERTWYDADGSQLPDGKPQIPLGNTEKIIIQCCSATPDAGTPGVAPETDWTKDTQFNLSGISALLSVDNNFTRHLKGTLKNGIEAGVLSSVELTIQGATPGKIPVSGAIRLYNADGTSEGLEYISRTISGTTVTFSLADGSAVTKSYAALTTADCPESLYAQAPVNAGESDPASGLFIFDIVLDSLKLREKTDYADLKEVDDIKGLELLVFTADGAAIETRNAYICNTFAVPIPMAEPNPNPQMPPTHTDTVAALISALLSNGLDVQCSTDGEIWLEYENITDFQDLRWFRIRIKGQYGEWSEAIPLIAGDAGQSVYPYVAYASDTSGTDFTLEWEENAESSLKYIAYKMSSEPIENPVAADFAGLWVRFGGLDLRSIWQDGDESEVSGENMVVFWRGSRAQYNAIENKSENTLYFVEDENNLYRGYTLYAAADYTAFEVYATDAEIPAGTVDDVTGLAYSVAVPAGMTHKFALRTDIAKADDAQADVVIDWGDETTSRLTDAYFVDESDWASDGECNYTMRHTYAVPGRYIVRIYGRDYWGIRNPIDNPATAANEYIISRCFAPDLPLASCVTNLASFCRYSRKLLKVHAPTGLDLYAHVHNAYAVFDNCINLVSATGLKTKFRYARDVSRMFGSCNNMTTCDFELPNTVIKQGGYDAVFKYCYELSADIAKLIPVNGFANRYVRLCETFSQCPKLTGTVRADMLWKDTSKVWSLCPNTGYQLPFEGCSEAIRAQVPVSWGGTNTEIVVPKAATDKDIAALQATLQAKITELENRIAALEPTEEWTGPALPGEDGDTEF